MLVELFDLQLASGGYEWKESARWLKYEEDIEGVDSHRGRPHVSFLSFSSILQLKSLFSKGIILFDPLVKNLDDLLVLVSFNLTNQLNVKEKTANSIANLLAAQRLRCYEGRFPFKRYQSFRKSKQSVHRMSLRDPGAKKVSTGVPKTSVQDMGGKKFSNVPKLSVQDMSTSRSVADDLSSAVQDSLECIDICTGSVDDLDSIILILVRLSHGMHFVEIEDEPVYVRFLILILGPPQQEMMYRQIGRSMSTLMANEKFHKIALETNNREKLTEELENILSESIVLPPVEIDNKDLFTIESIRKVTTDRRPQLDSIPDYRKSSFVSTIASGPTMKLDEQIQARGGVDPFARTGKPFGGTIRDIRSRFPYYWDDIKTALNFQCVTSILFIFFANFASAVALGEVLSDKIDGWMGVSEILLAHGICMIIWGLVAGQPLCIQAAVGPFMVFEESLYNFCKTAGVDFLAFRIWVSLWSFVMLIICALVEAPFLMRYLNRFTEEIFTGLIAIIFIYEAGKFMYKEFTAHPLQDLPTYCSLYDDRNKSLQEAFGILDNVTGSNFTYAEDSLIKNETAFVNLLEKENEGLTNQPDTALLQAVLVIITFVVALYLKKLRFSIYCGRTLRKAIGDFGVPIAVVVGTFIDQVVFSDVYTRHVTIKEKFDLTRPDLRGWFINPMGSGENMIPGWVIPAAILPALLVTILFYAEVEIIEKLLDKKEVCLKKPAGYHWDLIVVGALAFLCSLFGLQWMCPAAVQSFAHASSLAVMTKTAPGEAPKINYVLEQRITSIVVGILHAAAAFCGVALALIPDSVLFGLFLYLGFNGLMATQFWQRMVLLFVPKKYFPDEPYCQEVVARKVHLYTFIQFMCFAALWCINMFKQCALSFPFILMIIAGFRLLVVPKFFSPDELTSIEGKKQTYGGEIEPSKEDVDKDFYDHAHSST